MKFKIQQKKTVCKIKAHPPSSSTLPHRPGAEQRCHWDPTSCNPA